VAELQRVLVIGISGAGKSTFAQALAQRTGLPLVHLDKEFWQPGWVETPRSEWRARVAELVAGERWIKEGNYASSLDLRLPRANTVVWFDYPAARCLVRVLRRVAATHGQVRADMAPGCPEQLDWGFLGYVARFNRVERPKVVAALGRYGGHLDPVVFRRDADAEQFLARLA
jgi:adenylate kinase family enzyme